MEMIWEVVGIGRWIEGSIIVAGKKERETASQHADWLSLWLLNEVNSNVGRVDHHHWSRKSMLL